MGADARWVCHTCKTVCSRGGRPIFRVENVVDTRGGVTYLKELLARVNSLIELDDCDRYIKFLDDLHKWLGRHESHLIYVGSDYSTDAMDLEDYHEEAVDGKVSKMTRHKVNMSCLNAFEADAIEDIETLIQECIRGKLVEEAARELFNRFSMQQM